MSIFAVVKTGGKQYLVKEQDEIIVDKIDAKENDTIELDTLAVFGGDKLQVGAPALDKKAKALVVATMKGDKVRVAKFKAKVRYRKVRGFRPTVSKIKIVSI